MAKPFDYSKWDNIELSDDESDLHPNIDKDSWFRLKHRTRLEREEREDIEIKEYNEKTKVDEARIKVLKARINQIQNPDADNGDDDAQYEDIDALQVEVKELTEQIAKRNSRIEEINEKRKWNIDNICKVKDEKTIVNEVKSKSLKSDIDTLSLEDMENNDEEQTVVVDKTEKPAVIPAISTAPIPTTTPVPVPQTTKPKGSEPADSMKRERMAVINYNDFAIKHEKILEAYSQIHDLEKTKEYLFKHCDILLHEHAQSYILLSCLEDEMNGKHDRMKLVCRQSQILSHIHDLGTSMKRDPRDVILPFFKRITEAEYLQGFLASVDDFIKKIQKRAVEKRKEMDAQRAEEEDDEDFEYEGQDEAQLGPGGLNPFKVLKELPKIMRKAFESGDIASLHAALGSMEPEEAKHWMKQCVDSGLWVPSDPSVFTDEQETAAEEA